MNWNYLAVERVGADGRKCVALHEAYYDEVAGVRTLANMTDSPVEFVGDSLDDLRRSLVMALRDLDIHGLYADTR